MSIWFLLVSQKSKKFIHLKYIFSFFGTVWNPFNSLPTSTSYHVPRFLSYLLWGNLYIPCQSLWFHFSVQKTKVSKLLLLAGKNIIIAVFQHPTFLCFIIPTSFLPSCYPALHCTPLFTFLFYPPPLHSSLFSH